ncbi:MAG: molybdenum cofactor guanylyltransferase MobA [Pseudomonadota bacterium]|jgi:molybdopterin-guanine dinucleotide biosynthesis protein A
MARQDLTGLILAGGRGSRMGGVDKGLQPHRGQPLAWHALQRLRPQVGALMINANRNLDRYAALGEPVWPDVLPDQPGPLAGFLAGLAHCTTPWLLTVPCDTPFFPQDLAARLIAAVQAEGAELAIAATRELPDEGARAAGRRPEADGRVLQPQPVFCLLPLTLRDSLTDFVASGRRSIDRWTAQHRCATVVFDDAAAFANANTPEELARLQEG